MAVDSKDRVYAMTRNTAHPVMVFEADGLWVTSFGEGVFSDRTHGILVGPDDSIYCADDGTHTITKFNTDGKLLMTIGERNQPAPKWSGQPFNRPTHAAVSPMTGNLYVSDGYGNSRIHKYTGDGKYISSWGEPGIDAASSSARTTSPWTSRIGCTSQTASVTGSRCSTPMASSSRCSATSIAQTA